MISIRVGLHYKFRLDLVAETSEIINCIAFMLARERIFLELLMRRLGGTQWKDFHGGEEAARTPKEKGDGASAGKDGGEEGYLVFCFRALQ